MTEKNHRIIIKYMMFVIRAPCKIHMLSSLWSAKPTRYDFSPFSNILGKIVTEPEMIKEVDNVNV